jgi:hypothetical protein
MLGSFSLDTSTLLGGAPAIHAGARPREPREPSRIERIGWNVLTMMRNYPNADIDWYREKYGKANGEQKFFAAYEPDSVELIPGNMLLGNGASALWQFALGNGTASANSALGSGPTYFNNSQTYLYVGDAGITAGTGTISVSNAGTAVTFGSSQTGLIGKYLVMVGDSTGGLYLVIAGSGTSWTIATGYGGTTLAASSAGWSSFQSESHSQTALSGSTNTAHQIMDSTFPSNPTSAQFNAITGATAASPSVLTISGGDISTNDIVQVFEVNGLTGVNGMFVANPASASSVTLLGSTGTGSYTNGGIVTRRTVAKFQATFGPGAAQWSTGLLEWAITNGTGGNQIFMNRKCANMGVKTSGTTSLQVAIGVG